MVRVIKKSANWLLIIMVALIFYVVYAHPDWIVLPPVHADSAPADTYVPHTPTGCAYGDSIPVDSVKCAPPQSTSVYNATEPVTTAPAETFTGK
jgi:hypothetical protein